MTRLLMHLGPFALRFWHRFGIAYHRKAWGRCSLPTFLPARRFSAGFGRSSRCANLLQNAGHHATHLLRGNRPLLAFPGTLKSESKMFAQQQVIASTGQQPTPAFHLFGGTQMRLFPKQIVRCRKREPCSCEKRLRYQVRTCSKGTSWLAVQMNQLSRGSRLLSR